MKTFFANPLIVKEMKERFRTRKSIWLVALYLLVMGAMLLGIMYFRQIDNMVSLGDNRGLFILTAVIQYAMICFIAPALSAGAISGERERQTLHVLLTTHLTPGVIILSKLVTSLAFIFLLVIASLPLYSFVFLYGGISPQQLATLVLFFAVNIVFFGSLGLFCSTWIKRTGVSTITAYALTFFFVAGTGLVLLFSGLVINDLYASEYSGDDVWNLPALQILASLNPVMVMLDLLGESITPIQYFMEPWLFFSVCYLGITIILIVWSTYLLHPTKCLRWKWHR